MDTGRNKDPGLPRVGPTGLPKGLPPARRVVGRRTRVTVQDTSHAATPGGVVPETYVLRTSGLIQGVHSFLTEGDVDWGQGGLGTPKGTSVFNMMGEICERRVLLFNLLV